jgi:hypothetical protein
MHLEQGPEASDVVGVSDHYCMWIAYRDCDQRRFGDDFSWPYLDLSEVLFDEAV